MWKMLYKNTNSNEWEYLNLYNYQIIDNFNRRQLIEMSNVLVSIEMKFIEVCTICIYLEGT